jgi:hypothetical protein
MRREDFLKVMEENHPAFVETQGPLTGNPRLDQEIMYIKHTFLRQYAKVTLVGAGFTIRVLDEHGFFIMGQPEPSKINQALEEVQQSMRSS